ncbi:MAG: hypothetical protein QOG55_2846 [Acidobacteriaceae bacterium]|jgi:hypothetical protein|nr:hypothetical protein [Acidobacteriaceae bacterium]
MMAREELSRRLIVFLPYPVCRGADPSKLVKVTDVVSANTLPATDGDRDKSDQLGRFVTLRSAKACKVFRGVAFAPKDHGAADNRE